MLSLAFHSSDNLVELSNSQSLVEDLKMIRHEDIDDVRTLLFHAFFPRPGRADVVDVRRARCTRKFIKKKRRYNKNGFDLDLVYLSDRVIIHGFPAVGLEHLYRNPRYEIKRLLDTNHPGAYKVFNFCCEPGRGYEPAVFEGRVERYPFKDHNTPPLESMVAFANSAKAWLDADPKNVCSLHCKAGKGRAGLMACVLLLRSGTVSTAKEALDLYDKERVKNNRGLTVTSQRKFVMFYEALWRTHWGVEGNLGGIPADDPTGVEPPKYVVPAQPMLHLTGVEIVDAPPDLLKNVRVKVFKGTNFSPELKHDTGKGRGAGLDFSFAADIQGNFKVFVEAKGRGLLGKPAKVFELWHNTLFLDPSSSVIDLDRSQLDIFKTFRRQLGADLKLRLRFSPQEPAAAGAEVGVNGASGAGGYSKIATDDIIVAEESDDHAGPI